MRDTPSPTRLADDWHRHLTPERQRFSADLTARIAENDLDTLSDPAAVRHRIRDAVRLRLSERTLEECLAWLQTRSDWPNRVEPEDLTTELEETLALLPLTGLATAERQPRIEPSSWIAPCLIGGVVGGPLLGLGWVGALLGSTGAVAGLAWMLDQPALRARWEASVAQGRASGVDQGVQSRSAGLGALRLSGLPQRLGGKIGVQLLRWLIRAEAPGRAPVGIVALRQAIEDDFDLCASLLLLVCRSRLGARPTAAAAPALSPPARSVYDAIAPLAQAIETNGDDAKAIREMALELVQTMREEGLLWQTVSEGEPYRPDMGGAYETFGHIAVGQPVKTLKPALCAGDTVVVPGLLQRIRG